MWFLFCFNQSIVSFATCWKIILSPLVFLLLHSLTAHSKSLLKSHLLISLDWSESWSQVESQGVWEFILSPVGLKSSHMVKGEEKRQKKKKKERNKFLFLLSTHSRTFLFRSDQISYSVVSDSLRPHVRSTPGLPVHHQLPEFIQTHVHRVNDAIQPSHPLSSPSPAPNPSQHHSLFQWVNPSHEVAKVLESQL